MDLRFTPEEIAFREEVRTFFHTKIPAEIRANPHVQEAYLGA